MKRSVISSRTFLLGKKINRAVKKDSPVTDQCYPMLSAVVAADGFVVGVSAIGDYVIRFKEQDIQFNCFVFCLVFHFPYLLSQFAL